MEITIFGCAQVKIVWFTMWKLVIHDFRVRSSEILFSRDSRFTWRFQERNPTYNRELPVLGYQHEFWEFVKKKEFPIAYLTNLHYSQIHPALQQIPAHSTLELCLWLVSSP